MRALLLGFVDRLRRDGVRISVAESLDALAAVAAIGVAREPLREALAATLVKDEADRAGFETRFEEWFPLPSPEDGEEGERRKRRRRGGGGAAASGGVGTSAGRGGRAVERGAETPPSVAPGAGSSREDGRGRALNARPVSPAASAAARAAALRRLPFHEMTARDVQEARELVAELGRRLGGRLDRRRRHARRGALDVRRTLRAAVASGGVPLALRHRRRVPRRPDLLALCDLSGSVAAASELLLGLIAPAAPHFRRVQRFGFVDRLVPIAIERGHVAPDGPIDLYARSDFGHVLADLWRAAAETLTRDTLVLVLGDARNNRRPPRVDLLRAVRERVRAIYWLVPEPRLRWDTGDSVLRLYAPSCDAVLECLTLEALMASVQRLW